jgi:hypothetical protein
VSIRNCINTENSRDVLAYSYDIEEKLGLNLFVRRDMLIAFSVQAHLCEEEKIFLCESFSFSSDAPIAFRKFIGFLFYPYQRFQESTHTNFNQLPLSFKLSILLSSKYGFEPANFLLLTSHIGSTASMSKGVVERVLQLPFCLTDFSICSSLRKVALSKDNAQWFVKNAKISNDVVYISNSYFLLERIGYSDEELSKKVSSLDVDTACAQSVYKILSTPFALENIIVLNCVKSFALEGENLTSIVEGVRSSRSSILVANTGFLFKMLGHFDLAAEMFMKGEALHSRRLGIELFSLNFDQTLVENISFFNLPEEDQSGLRAFGMWKLAQCYRYGRKIDRSLEQANQYYLQAVAISASNSQNCFPEIHYDAGDFALYCASICSNPEQKILALNYALQHFRSAAGFGMEAAFTKEDEVTTLHPELVETPGVFNKIAQRAVLAGYLKTAQGILNRHRLNRPVTVEDLKPWADAEQINIDFEKLFYKETKW